MNFMQISLIAITLLAIYFLYCAIRLISELGRHKLAVLILKESASGADIKRAERALRGE